MPTEEAKKSSGEAFYFLSDHYDEWKERKDFKESIHLLKEANCFPADDDTEKWYTASDLYAPYRAEAFNSQVYVLGYRNTSRLKTELLKELGISTEPEPQTYKSGMIVPLMVFSIGIKSTITLYTLGVKFL